MKAYNIPVDESLIYTGDLSIGAGKAGADYYLVLPEPPDAIFAVEDFSALGLVNLQQKHFSKYRPSYRE